VACGECHAEWTPEDPDLPGACPHCSSRLAAVIRCPSCPLSPLGHVFSRSSAGHVLERALQLDNLFPPGSALPWVEITAEEVLALKILREERDKYTRERMPQPNGSVPDTD
jgi:hypothetical protein